MKRNLLTLIIMLRMGFAIATVATVLTFLHYTDADAKPVRPPTDSRPALTIPLD